MSRRRPGRSPSPRRPPNHADTRGLSLPDPSEDANLAILTGAILQEPTRGVETNQEPITRLLVGVKPPNETGVDRAASVPVEVLDSIADPQRRWLREGRRLVVLGRLTGNGALWASAIVTEMPTSGALGVRPG